MRVLRMTIFGEVKEKRLLLIIHWATGFFFFFPLVN